MKRSLFERTQSYLYWRAKEIINMPARVSEFLFSTLYNDLILARNMRRQYGAVTVGPKILIFTVYPVGGVRTSHLDTLRAAVTLNYSPIVVSNLPLSAPDIAMLKPYCWQIIERPNFGYDFGAFREGMRTIKAQAKTMESLVLVNDSIWCPVGTENWLRQVAKSEADFVGAVSNYGLQSRFSPRAGGDLLWEYDPSLPGFHYCSFALRIGVNILRDPGFWRFWDGLRLSNDKITTVRRGEVGLSYWVMRNGFSHTTTYPIGMLLALINESDNLALRAIAKDLVIPEDPALRGERDALLEDVGVSEADLRNFIFEVIMKTGLAYVAPVLGIDHLGVSFLKKSPLWLDRAGAAVTMSLLKKHCSEDYLVEAHEMLKIRL